jgi:hypothetical protein
LRSFQAQKQLQGLTQNLLADLHLARSTALGASQNVVLRTSTDGLGYRILRCPTPAGCDTPGDAVKVVTFPSGVAVTPNRLFEFQAPRGVLQGASQSACLTGQGDTPRLKVMIDNSLGKATACSVGQASNGLAACASAC